MAKSFGVGVAPPSPGFNPPRSDFLGLVKKIPSMCPIRSRVTMSRALRLSHCRVDGLMLKPGSQLIIIT
jgi:hypothetical protein